MQFEMFTYFMRQAVNADDNCCNALHLYGLHVYVLYDNTESCSTRHPRPPLNTY